MFTGSPRLFLSQGRSLITRWLVSLPVGIREFTSTWFHAEDPLLTAGVVEKCARTIEIIGIALPLRTPISHRRWHRSLTFFLARPVATDLSKATKLKNAVFRFTSMSAE